MARVTHVQKAQQRYATVQVTDAEGNVIKTPVINKRTGEQKVTKTGRPVYMTKTVADKSKPLGLLSCDFGGCTINGGKIAVGSAYKHITPKSGPYGGTQKNRHAEHPNWNIWEYSYSLSAQVARVQSDAGDLIANYDFGTYDDFDDLKSQVVEMAGDLRDEKEESLSNMPEGLADGSVVEEQFNALEEWVDEIENAEAPEQPEPEPKTKWFATGPQAQSLDEDGYDEEDEAQAALDTFLEENPDESEDDWSVDEQEVEDEVDEDEVDEDWAEEAKQALQDALDNCQA